MKEVLLPELAESVVEGEILKWLVSEGDTIVLEQPLCEVMTDKVTVELPSPVAGVLHRRLAGEGDVVAVHAAIALIDETGGAAPQASAPAPVPQATATQAPSIQAPSIQAQEERDQIAGAQEDRGGSIVEAGHLASKTDDDASSLFKAFASDEQVQVQGLGV
ncbi:2-oxo acid dehydrogenase subunit E2, partial [Deinococcus sp. 6YEL10]|uniref:biotin/lipoyl-containing protein n=1 Tax=Deinococcus sp. 6YEL10 TaxID=2745870 RepID=UPI0027146630